MIHVERLGEGPPVMLVHGAVTNGELTWPAQRPLAERWRLIVVDRRGHFPNPPAEREDFEVDAQDVADLLTEPTHLVGDSYGGLGVLLGAARRPEMVQSLTVNEAPAFALLPDDPDLQQFLGSVRELFAHGPRDPAEFLPVFLAHVGLPTNLPDPLPPPLLQGAYMLRNERMPEEAEIPGAVLRAAPFPKLVVSGGHSPVFEAVSDALAQEIGADRAVVRGAGHDIPSTGPAYNSVLERFLAGAV